jgi:hypothetical protein
MCEQEQEVPRALLLTYGAAEHKKQKARQWLKIRVTYIDGSIIKLQI